MLTVQFESTVMYSFYTENDLWHRTCSATNFSEKHSRFALRTLIFRPNISKKNLTNGADMYILYEYYYFSFRFHSVVSPCKNILRALQHSKLCLSGLTQGLYSSISGSFYNEEMYTSELILIGI
jgi:hypothetical protein